MCYVSLIKLMLVREFNYQIDKMYRADVCDITSSCYTINPTPVIAKLEFQFRTFSFLVS